MLISRPELAQAAEALQRNVRAAALEPLTAALDRELCRRAGDFHAGIERYRRHPYARDLDAKPILWEEGTTRLLDYGGTGPPLLVVPSLINRAYILDLNKETSLLRYLAGSGVRPLLIDWGAPGEAERRFGLTEYVAGRLEAALDVAEEVSGAAPGVMGYCMGGLLALALAQRRRHQVKALALLATPWSFHAERAGHARLLGALAAPLALASAPLMEMPVDLLQTLFTAADPLVALRKFSRFATLPEGPRVRHFVAVEDWLNDGVPLALAVARECLGGWYGQDTPARGLWRIAGQPVLPRRVVQPTLVVVPGQDRIVPPESAAALAAALPAAQRLTPALGHIGMIVGGAAPRQVWRPLARWLMEQLGGAGSQTRPGTLSKGRGTRSTRASP